MRKRDNEEDFYLFMAGRKSKPIRIKEKIIKEIRESVYYKKETTDTEMINIELAKIIMKK